MKIVILFGLLALIVISTVWITTKNDKQITDSYIACGCGCCDLDNPKVECLYKSNGDSLQKIIDEDKKSSQSPDCNVVGCNLPVKYIYCD